MITKLDVLIVVLLDFGSEVVEEAPFVGVDCSGREGGRDRVGREEGAMGRDGRHDGSC